MRWRTILGRACRWAGLAPLWLSHAVAACPPALAPANAAQIAAAESHDRGLLWSIERDGRTSYLYGTLHVGKPAWMHPGPRVSEALAASDVLALEIDPGDPGVQAELSHDDHPAPRLPAALQARLARQVQAACVPAAALAGMNPAMQAVMLGVLEARWAGLDPGYAQEQALAQRARASGREVVSLETVALQKKALVPASDSETLEMIDSSLDELESGSGRRVIARLAQAWEDGDLATIAGYERWCECVHTPAERAALRALNDDRNPGLAEHIEALHAAGRRVFAAVGALHMTGAQGLPGLLQARGFRVRRIVFGP